MYARPLAGTLIFGIGDLSQSTRGKQNKFLSHGNAFTAAKASENPFRGDSVAINHVSRGYACRVICRINRQIFGTVFLS